MMLLLQYARERLMRWPMLAAILLVTTGAQAGRGFSTATRVAIDLAIALCLVISFRIWDDVMDRDRDRIRHPERVLVRTGSTGSLSLTGFGIAMAGAAVLLLTRGAAAVSLLIVFSLVLATWYAVRDARSAAGDRILLFKYAVFTLALIGPARLTPRAAIGALGVYLAVCAYERRHDPESPVFSVGGSR